MIDTEPKPERQAESPPAGANERSQSHRGETADGSFIRDAAPLPPARGEKWLRATDATFQRLDALIHRAIPLHLNPLSQTGAIANTAFLIATVTGIFLLFWYSPSVHNAHASLEGIREGSWLGQLMRSLHRYSSDACMLFIILHAIRIVAARRIFGPRWVAWVSGVGLLGIMWLIGWTGYWLVWDTRAQHVAEGTARFIDVLPIFGQPLASTFLTNDTVPSLLFFLIFFAHMLLPLAIGVGLWVHLSRLNRAKLLTNRHLTAWIVGTMIVLSIIFPATSSEPADMTAITERFTMDWWYLWPIWLTDRLGGGALWAIFLFGTIAFAATPWWMKRRGTPAIQKAFVDLPSCNGCTLCSKDCPFDAISMVPREDGKRVPVQSQVDPDKCVGCGICTGACDSDAISLPWLDVKTEKRRIEEWINAKLSREERPLLAFVCAESAGAEFPINAATGECPALPGYRVRAIPCAGWVSAVLIEHCLKGGAAGVLVAGCGPGEPGFREGSKWLRQRLDGQRRPILRKNKVDVQKVRFVQFNRSEPSRLIAAARDFRSGRVRVEKRRGRIAGALAGSALAAVLAVLTAVGSVLPYTPPARDPELVISFRHLAERLSEASVISPEDQEHLPVHMRGQVHSDRRRAPVRLEVEIGGEILLGESYPARGLRSDGASIVLERIPLPEGVHQATVRIGDTAEPEEWPYEWSGRLEIPPDSRRVLLFENGRFHLE